jgi:hypothetical protein
VSRLVVYPEPEQQLLEGGASRGCAHTGDDASCKQVRPSTHEGYASLESVLYI